MKEPWKKSCNAPKVVITLNDEEKPTVTTPTEIEVPVDLTWTRPAEMSRCNRISSSSSKTIVLVSILLVFGLTAVILYKIQNLVYSTTDLSWRLQELESTVNKGNDGLNLIKHKLLLDESNNEARAEALIASPNRARFQGHNNIESQDPKLSEDQNSRKLSKSAQENFEKNISKEFDKRQLEYKERSMDNDTLEHPDPTDGSIKPLVAILEDFNRHADSRQYNFENNFIKSILLASAKKESEGNNVLPITFQKHSDTIPNIMSPLQGKLINNPQEPVDFLGKNLFNSKIKIIHLNEKSLNEPRLQVQNQLSQLPIQSQKQLNADFEDKTDLRLELPSELQFLPLFDSINKPSAPIEFFGNGLKKLQDLPIDEVKPKIVIKSVRVKMVPFSFRDYYGTRKEQQQNHHKQQDILIPNLKISSKNDNFEVFRVSSQEESPELSHEIEVPKMPVSFPFDFNPLNAPGFIENILGNIPTSTKKSKIIPPYVEGAHKQDEIVSKTVPDIQDFSIKNLSPMTDLNKLIQHAGYSQNIPHEQSHVEMSKVQVYSPIPLELMESLLPMNNRGDSVIQEAEEQLLPEQQQLNQIMQRQTQGPLIIQQQQQLPDELSEQQKQTTTRLAKVESFSTGHTSSF